MSTRSNTRIYIKSFSGGHYHAMTFYRHHDGYPEGHGAHIVQTFEKHGCGLLEGLHDMRHDIEPVCIDSYASDADYDYSLYFSSGGKKLEKIRIEHIKEWGEDFNFYGTPKELDRILFDRYIKRMKQQA